MMRLRVDYSFHPVGQGLFSSGALRSDQSDRHFRWIYDCGTTSAQKHLVDAIGKLFRRALNRPRRDIDLVAVSHFDRDHISGLAALLSRCTVQALLLPYVPLWQRLMLADAEGVGAQEPLFSLFVDPVTYITGLDGAQIGQIILVPPSGDAGPDGGGEGTPPSFEGDGSWPLDVDDSPVREEQLLDYAAFIAKADKAGTKVRFMPSGGSLRVARIWEFVPYNDAELAPKATTAFCAQIASLQARLVNAETEESRSEALDAIKQTYDAMFGQSARRRNQISLFLYGGPLKSWSESRRLRWAPKWGNWGVLADWTWRQPQQRGRPKVSILYTGDGYLDTLARAERLLDYLGRYSRVGQLCAVQVMHHGARGNWHKGVAARLAPSLSIFSSDPTNKKLGHPHKPVLDDFSPYQPVQVDKSSGCRIVARIET
jgi:hypothetical protein